jgi:hypothetical protein
MNYESSSNSALQADECHEKLSSEHNGTGSAVFLAVHSHNQNKLFGYTKGL